MSSPGAALVVCAPLRIEQWAAQRGLPSDAARVIRVGMGPARAGEGLHRAVGNGPIAIVGVAGGLTREVRSGHVVVATSVATDDDQHHDCDESTALAELLRDIGLTVHLGRIVSTPHLVTGATRGELAAGYDAIATDMESGYLAAAIGPSRPVAVVRVVVDTVDQPLVRPDTVVRVVRGLANLSRAVAVLPKWAALVTEGTPTEGTG